MAIKRMKTPVPLYQVLQAALFVLMIIGAPLIQYHGYWAYVTFGAGCAFVWLTRYDKNE